MRITRINSDHPLLIDFKLANKPTFFKAIIKYAELRFNHISIEMHFLNAVEIKCVYMCIIR